MKELYTLSMTRIWWIYLVIWAGLMLTVGYWDISLSCLLKDSTCPFGQIVNDWGVTPGWIFVGLSLLSLFTTLTLLPKSLAKLILIQGIVQGLIITHFLKTYWGRVRPNDLSPDQYYTPFYTPHGPGSGESFPSGHVATAMVLAPIPFYYWKRGRKKMALLTIIPIGLYWFAVSFGRVRFGVHYPTDCLFSVGLGILLAGLSTQYLVSKSDKS